MKAVAEGQPPARKAGYAVYVCPICHGGKRNNVKHCSECTFGIDKLMDKTRAQLQVELHRAVKQVMLIEATLASCQ